MKRILCFLVLVLAYMPLQAQDARVADRQLAIDQIIELISENLEAEDLDFTTLLEDLNYYYEHPLNLNRANAEELERLYLLSEFQIRYLLRHIDYAGRLISIYELQGVDGFDLSTIQAILPFVKVSDQMDRPVLKWSEIKKEGSHEAFVRWQRVVEEMEGYSAIDDSTLAANPNRRYLGSPERILSRYRFRYLNNISVGLTLEKDAGEEFRTDSLPATFDFYSGHIYFGNYGFVKHAVVGDYQVRFGQGLNFWTGLAFGKSADISSIKRTAREISPYSSADENNFMRGAATTIELGKFEVTGFYSRKKVDANVLERDTSLADNGDQVVAEFSSFQTSGFHRTPGELKDKDAIDEMNTGGHLRYMGDQIQVGFTGVYTKYFGTFNRTPQLYNKFEPTASSYFVGGMDYQVLIRNILAFGEVSQHSDGGTAFLNGAIVSIDPKLDVSIFQRYYQQSYANPRGNAVGESSRNTNEQGIYFGITSKFNSKWTFRGYYDMFSFPWLRFQTSVPSNGNEYLAQLEYKPSRKTLIYARYRFENKLESVTIDERATRSFGTLKRQWVRLNFQYSLSKSLSLRNRIEYTGVRLPEGNFENGWLIYQDLVYKPWRAKYQFKVRYALFDTESYASRIYAYEHDVLYSFSVPAYYHRGSRFYFIAGYDISRWSDITVRVAQTYFSNQDENGSGLNTVDGPTRTEVKVQLRVKF